jgi:hypothetical protein
VATTGGLRGDADPFLAPRVARDAVGEAAR